MPISKSKRKEARLNYLKTLDNGELNRLVIVNKDEIAQYRETMCKTHSFVYCVWCKNRIKELLWENEVIEDIRKDRAFE